MAIAEGSRFSFHIQLFSHFHPRESAHYVLTARAKMNRLVFVTFDITPEVRRPMNVPSLETWQSQLIRGVVLTPTQQWAEFADTAFLLPEDRGESKHHRKPYALVHSPSQELKDLVSGQDRIPSTVKTEFNAATWETIRSCHNKLYHQDPKQVHPVTFLILDEQSVEDRNVIIISKGSRYWFTSEGLYADESMSERKDLVRRWVWKKYRVPFKEA